MERKGMEREKEKRGVGEKIGDMRMEEEKERKGKRRERRRGRKWKGGG